MSPVARMMFPKRIPSRVAWRHAALPLMLAAAVLLSACEQQPAAMPQGPGAMKVQVYRVAPREIVPSIEWEGRIVAREPVLIYAQIDGVRVERVFVDAGQMVSAGQPLVQLDRRALHSDRLQAEQQQVRALAEVANARDRLAQSDSRLRSAEDEIMRFSSVADSGAVSELDVRQRKAQLEQAQAERDAAAQNLVAAQADEAAATVALRLASERERDGLIRAPVTGVVSERHVEVGQITAAVMGPLFRLVQRSDREFETWVDADRLASLRVGDAVDVRATSTNKHGFVALTGKVRSIDGALAAETLRGRVRVAFSGDREGQLVDLVLGSSATATLIGAPVAGLSVPATALQFDPKPWVYVVDADDRIAKRHIVLAQDEIIVLHGLVVGDTVVRSAAALLSTGQLVEPVYPASEQSAVQQSQI